jgi:hypothetical protein
VSASAFAQNFPSRAKVGVRNIHRTLALSGPPIRLAGVRVRGHREGFGRGDAGVLGPDRAEQGASPLVRHARDQGPLRVELMRSQSAHEQLTQSTLSGENRFLALSARSLGRS